MLFRETFVNFINQEKLAAIVYCDGSVLERPNGNGGCGSIITHEGYQLKRSQSESTGRLTDSVSCEVEGIKLGLQQALRFHEEFQPTSDKCFILSDCESAIQIVSNQVDIQKNITRLTEINELKRKLEHLNVEPVLGWIPGHCGIQGNEDADAAAKEGCRKPPDSRPVLISLDAIKSMVRSQCIQDWQRKWNHSPSGSFTRQIIRNVNTNLFLPNSRCVSMTLARSLQNCGGVADKLFEWNLADSPNCDCGSSRQTIEHVITECLLHSMERQVLRSEIEEVWRDLDSPANLNINLQLLLNPASCLSLNRRQAMVVARCFSKFIVAAGIKI